MWVFRFIVNNDYTASCKVDPYVNPSVILVALGASHKLAAKIAKNGRRWWHNSARGLNRISDIKQ
jgi:hypothetical protein